MTGGVPQPVRRGDGAEYPSISAAARALVAEQGVGDPDIVTGNINHVLRGDIRTAYGYRWERIEHDGDQRAAGVRRPRRAQADAAQALPERLHQRYVEGRLRRG